MNRDHFQKILYVESTKLYTYFENLGMFIVQNYYIFFIKKIVYAKCIK